MCSSPSVPKAAPPQEPMKQAASRSLEASDAAVREQAAALMDPMRGSPAAGGSRDAAVNMYAQLVRQLEGAQPEVEPDTVGTHGQKADRTGV